MLRIILKILTFTLPWIVNPSLAQEIWIENFSLPDKGIWVNDNGDILSDLSGITSWTLDITGVVLSGRDSYAKTVSTSGGRFECRKIEGEVIWLSEIIDIGEYSDLNIKLTAYETGSGNNKKNKYLKAFYKLDDGKPIPFDVNGDNSGNWGSTEAKQLKLNGSELQIICKMANHYSNDKVTLDNIIVWQEQEPVEKLKKGDLIITEVLFNPFPGGKDYVEIFNPRKIKLPVDYLYIANRDNNMEPKQVCPVFNTRFIFQPESYIVITTDKAGITDNYMAKCPECIHVVNKIPAFNIDEGYVLLLNEESEVIDEMHYTEEIHSPFLRNNKGVSLEKISVHTPSENIANWHSGSSESGYGTPGYQNSQSTCNSVNSPAVIFEPDSFSPDHDGFNDKFNIKYSLDKPGYVANVKIFDSSGRFLMPLIQNELLGTEGTITWEGKDKTGQSMPVGIYIVTIEIFNRQGEVYHFKDAVVLTGLLE